MLVRQTWGTHYIDFLYDESGSPYSLIYDGVQYYYVKNVQGEVVQIRSVYGTLLVEYTYDAWGNVLSITGSNASVLGANNPIRYISYYYDFETGFYYLQSRYYDPVVGRFVNPDGIRYLGANGDVIGYNLYSYCSNNPVSYIDPNGHFVITISTLLIGLAIGAGIGAGISLCATIYTDYSDDKKIFNGSVGIDEYIGNTVSGLISGAGIGVCSVLGAGLGAAMIAGETLLVGGTVFSGAMAFNFATSAAFVTGGIGYIAKTAINTKETFQMSDMFIEAGINTISGMISFIGGMIGGITGVKIPGAKSGLVNFVKYHSGMMYFGAYSLKAFLSPIKKGLQEAY